MRHASPFARVLAFATALCCTGSALSATPAAPASQPAGVGIVHGAAWNVGDTVREGAGEFAVLLEAARLQRDHPAAGLIAVGDRSGFLRSGGERALRHVVFTGVAVVKLAPRGEVTAADQVPFLDGGSLSAEAAASTLARCLAQHGAPPAVGDPENPTRAELAAIRAHLQPFQAALARAAAPRVAGL